MSFRRNFLTVPSHASAQVLHRPPGLLQGDLPCIEESSLHSNGDGIKQISTTFQQLRETGSEEKRKNKRHVLLKYYPN